MITTIMKMTLSMSKIVMMARIIKITFMMTMACSNVCDALKQFDDETNVDFYRRIWGSILAQLEQSKCQHDQDKSWKAVSDGMISISALGNNELSEIIYR